MLAVLAESALRSLLLGSVVWVGLNLFRVRNPHVQMTSWIMVLVASLAMPLLMHWATVTVTLAPLPLPGPDNLWPAESPLSEPLGAALPSESDIPAAAVARGHAAINWWTAATIGYACVAGLLLLRLAVGLCLTWRLVRAAKPMREPIGGSTSDVRVSDVIGGPVTFGSTILLPPQWIDWTLPKRQAVLAHEGAHVDNRDFYLLLLASLNRAVFWFSPFAWWQLARLAELAEIISDARAVEALDDRLSYAEILLDLVQAVRRAPAGLEMARASTVRARVERILAATATPATVARRKRLWIAAAIVPAVVVSAASIATSRPPAFAPVLDEAETVAHKPQLVDFYSVGPRAIFAVFREGDDRFGQLSGQRKRRLSADEGGTYSYPAAAGQITLAASDEPQPSELVLRQNGRDMHAARIAEIAWQDNKVDAQSIDAYVGWYELGPSRVLTITRDGERMVVQETGRLKFAVAAHGVDAFSSSRDDLVIFLRDGQGKVIQALFQDPVSGPHLAPRIAVARARAIEDDFARRLAEAPDRFRDQSPQPGSKEAILRGIADMQNGTPNYDRMSASLAAKIRREAPQAQAMFKALGAVESIFFRGVGPGGYDIYGVKFANGSAEFRLLLGADHKAEDVIFRPDGNDTPGGIAACSTEATSKSRGETVPIRLFFYNDSGTDVQLYSLDTEGKRVAHGTIGQEMSSVVLTYVDSPWVIADPSGACLEIVQPGQRTRYHVVEPAGGSLRHLGPPRLTPQAGSEEMLRHYIDGVARGEPDYDHMTSEVASQTRAQLPFNQAILSRLGALRAVSFRGVTGIGTDVYMAHFANGTAEWRIALSKDGTIGRIALGPQS